MKASQIALLLLGVVAAPWLAGCAGAPADETVAAADDAVYGQPDCFYSRDVYDFRPLNNRQLLVYGPGGNRAYQVRISPPSADLRSAQNIAFDTRSGRICGYAGDSIYFRGASGPRYSVISVRRLNSDELEALLGNFGIGPAAEPPEPESSPGAAIEPLEGATPDPDSE